MFEKLKRMLSSDQGFIESRDQKQDERNLMIATAVIFLEVANADEEFSSEERTHILTILKERFHLGDEEVGELLKLSEEERKGSIDIWHFTNIINNMYNDEEKERVIENVWRVIYADGSLDKYEDQIVHKLSILLHIPHSKMIKAKLKFSPKN